MKNVRHKTKIKNTRQQQFKAMTTNRQQATKQSTNSEQEEEPPQVQQQHPVLRSCPPFMKTRNIDKPYVVNLQTLAKVLHQCQHCNQGPLDLCNTEDVRTQGVSSWLVTTVAKQTS